MARERSRREKGARTGLARAQDLWTEAGRKILYDPWLCSRLKEGMMDPADIPEAEERAMAFADWWRTSIQAGLLDPQSRWPAYRVWKDTPFGLSEQQVAQVIDQLRTEKILPARKRRKDRGRAKWTQRDDYCLWYIGQMRAMRIDQLQRLLARESPSEVSRDRLSISRTAEMVQRWQSAGLVVEQRIFHKQPAWISLTRKGLRMVDLPFRADLPSLRVLEHLYWINEVRMHLEEEYEEMEWISERSLQAEKKERVAGVKLPHIPDGILRLPESGGGPSSIEIEVQVSRPTTAEVTKVILDENWMYSSAPALRYYVNRLSRGAVQTVYRRMRRERSIEVRGHIALFDLQTWLPIPL